MPGDVALLSPFDESAMVELSTTLFRKRVLPVGEISYKGRKIKFDNKYLSDLSDSFRAGAFDQVAFLLAKDDNSHTLDPERFRGEVKGMEVTPDGLDVLLDLTPDAADMVRKNPNLGVSARIVEQLERADGQTFPRAMHHVLGTLDPRVTGLGPWQEVNLSEDVKDTLDLTQEEVTNLSDTAPQAPPTASPPTNPAAAPPAPSPTIPAPPAPAPPTPPVSSADEGPWDEDDLNLDDMTDEELAELAAEFSTIQGDSNTIDLQDAGDSEALNRVRALEMQLSRERYVNEARIYLERGIPPVLVELARPILSLPRAPVIDLANEEGGVDHIDVGQLVRDMLEQTKGFIQLAQESGSTFMQDDGETREDAVLNAWEGGL